MQKLNMYEFCAIALMNKDCHVTSYNFGSKIILTLEHGDVYITELNDVRKIEQATLEFSDGNRDGYSYETADYSICCLENDIVVTIGFHKDGHAVCLYDTAEII